MYIAPPPLQPTRILAGCIAVWDEVVKEPLKIIEDTEFAVSNPNNPIAWQRATVHKDEDFGPMISYKRTNSILNLNESGRFDEAMRIVNNEYYMLLLAASNWYGKHFDLSEGIYFKEDFSILKYSTTEEFKSHYDGGTALRRVISPILYLNDDYEGGWLEFTNYGIVEKPKAGSLYIFPSNFAYRHIAHPVTEGTKYAIVTFLHDQA